MTISSPDTNHYYEARLYGSTEEEGYYACVYHYDPHDGLEVVDYESYPVLTEQRAIELAELWCSDNGVEAERT